MKKWIVLLLTLTFVLAFAGCKEQDPQPGILDGGADIGVDAATKPQDDATETDNTEASLDGILDGGTDIGVDAES